LPTVKKLAEILGKAGLQLLKLRWLEGRVAAGLGQTEQAVAALEEVRQAFTKEKIAYSAALVSLNLALLYLQQGRTAEVRALAEEMIWIFQEKKIRREALAALTLFCQAARQEAATVDLARTAITGVEQAERQG
jgi:tetratricopeptide (TPR) repeat protein